METKLSTHRLEAIFLRDKNLVEDVIGKMSFTDAMFYHIVGTPPTCGQTAVLDAVLVTLMEHGLTPSAISTRLTYLSAPEAIQSAIAAGLVAHIMEEQETPTGRAIWDIVDNSIANTGKADSKQ